MTRRKQDDAASIRGSAKPKVPVLISLDEVESKPIVWLWRGWIPAGMLSICDGLPGDGKSTMLIDIAARVSTGREMPDGSPGVASGGVLFLSFEDPAAEILRPRFEAAGADLPRVHVHHPETEESFSLGKGCALESMISEHAVSIVIIDPLITAVPGGTDMHKGQDARRVLTPLARIAARTGAAIIGVRHFNKGEGRSALLRGEGSIGISGTARSVFVVAKDLDDDRARVLARSKSNLGPPVTSRSFALVGCPDRPDVPRIDWRGESRYGADDLTGPADPGSRGALEKAVDFLRGELADGPKPSADLHAAADVAGHSKRTVKRARDELGVQSRKIGDAWVSSLPPASQPEEAAGLGAAPP